MAVSTKYNILGTGLEYPIKLSRDDARAALAKLLMEEGQGWCKRVWTCGMYTDLDNMIPEDYTLHILYHFGLVDAHKLFSAEQRCNVVAFRINQRGLDFLKEDV